MKKLLIVCGLALLGMQHVSAQKVDDFGIFQHFGANVGVGTEGISIGIAAPVTNYLEISMGLNFMPAIKPSGDVNIKGGSVNVPQMSGPTTPVIDPTTGMPVYKTYALDKVNIKGNTARTTFDFKVSAYPFGLRNAFFVTAGFSFGGKKIAKLEGFSPAIASIYAENPYFTDLIDVEVDKYNIAVDRSGHVNGDVRVNAFRPYLGLGYGRLVPKGRVGFRVELGCQFMGKMKIYQNDQELVIDNTINASDDLSKIIDKWKVYPVLKLMLTTRIL
jgi:hypothetical protein